MKILCPTCGDINPPADHVCLMSRLVRKEELDEWIPQRDKAAEN